MGFMAPVLILGLAFVLSVVYGGIQTIKAYGSVENELENVRKISIAKAEEADRYKVRSKNLQVREMNANELIDKLAEDLAKAELPKPREDYCLPGCLRK